MSQITADHNSTTAHDDGHGHGHSPHLAHHFDSMEQQFDSAKLGIWLFLATEVLFFGGLFVAYGILRMRFPEVFAYCSHYLDTMMGGINTCVLILSSVTMALAVRFAQTNNKRGLIVCLVLTLMGAIGFLVIKYFEYTHKIHEHLVWGPTFYEPTSLEESAALKTAPVITTSILVKDPTPFVVPQLAPKPAVEASAIKTGSLGPVGVAAKAESGRAPSKASVEAAEVAHEEKVPHLEDAKMPANSHLFFGIYFAMTGLHGIHVVVGMIVISWLIMRAWRNDFSSQNYTAVDAGGLYWHIVDLIWIFLFPLFYLIH